ncbi:hypothetical protein HIJ39_14265 [Sulfobacillus sp. DSM 109850]|uniref:Uncharacterized protein n=2 Tax=Sulfobacillus harzensis TaxID=2729629 RepID=A0A7Y0Q2T5_9FIRM|nr:hypothetical protein [Sulfobacillus harzensis]
MLAPVAVAFLVAGCGIQAAQASQYIHVQPNSSNVDIKLVSSFNNDLAENVVDGAPAGHLTITVPVGSRVHLDVVNNGPMPETFGIYQQDLQLAFNNSGDPFNSDVNLNAAAGLVPGQSQTYTFTASHTGTYTIADYLNGTTTNTTPTSNIWETFKVVPSGAPAMITQ